MNDTMNRLNKRVNRKKICSVLTDVDQLDGEKHSVLADMRHDFFAHLADRQSDRTDRQRRTITAIRQQFQSILLQIPSNIQNLTLEEIQESGGTVGLTDGPNDEKTFVVEIPKSMIGSSVSQMPQMMKSKKPVSALKQPPQPREASAVKTATKGRVTRSVLKGHNTRQVLAAEVCPAVDAKPSTIQKQKNKSDTILSVLPQLKAPRNPKADEEMITITFSTAGTPLVVQPKATERINTST